MLAETTAAVPVWPALVQAVGAALARAEAPIVVAQGAALTQAVEVQEASLAPGALILPQVGRPR